MLFVTDLSSAFGTNDHNIILKTHNAVAPSLIRVNILIGLVIFTPVARKHNLVFMNQCISNFDIFQFMKCHVVMSEWVGPILFTF